MHSKAAVLDSSKATETTDVRKPDDQTAAESQSTVQVAEQRIGYDYGASAVGSYDLHEDHHHHEEHHHDPGFWKKKVEWKLG